MPIYEYQCANCDHEFETIQRFSDAPLKVCPACGKDTLAKKISPAGFRLKGGGWYETDFKGSAKRNVAGEGASSADSGSGDGGTAESTNAASSGEPKSSGAAGSSGEAGGGDNKPASAG
jgi:putative FmdB family regulatory protein